MDNAKMISSRELVQKTICRQITNRVPKGELCFDDEVVDIVLKSISPGFAGDIGFEERYKFFKWLGLDLVSLSPAYPADRLPDHTECIVPDIEKWTEETDLFVFVILDGAFEWGIRVFGFQEYMMMVMRSPEKVTDFVHQVEKLNMNLMDRLAEQGINGVILADDIADRDRLMLRPAIFREIFLPSMERQVKALSDRGLPAFFHSDGNYQVIIDDLINIGFVGLNCIDKNCGMDINTLQEQYGNRLCFWGHLGVDDVNKGINPEIKNPVGLILGTNSGLFSGLDMQKLKTIYSSI